MMSFRRLAAGALAVALLAIPLVAMLFLTGCRKKDKLFVDSNLFPDTRLTSAPGPYTQANYRIHLYWGGTDPDGFVVAYHYAWDDTVPNYGADNSPWRMTTKSDSLFKALIDTAGETRRHTFYIRAVDNEGKLDPTPARVRFDAWTVVPAIDSLYRIDGPYDPGSPNYEPGAKDTVLMGSEVSFLWGGWDPDGLGAPIQYSYRLDSDPFSEYSDATTVSLGGGASPISSGTHYFYVKAKDETGAENFPESYKFVMNFEPDSEIILPDFDVYPSGTLLVPDGDTIRFEWIVRDKEELMGVEGGIEQIWINIDSDRRYGFPVNPDGSYRQSFYFTANVAPSDSHYIASVNPPQGGNYPHTFEVSAKDIEGTFEMPSNDPDDREVYVFRYNEPPDSWITYPSDGETLYFAADIDTVRFTATWDGIDNDGEIAAFQYCLDPTQNPYRVCQVSETQACTSIDYALQPGWGDSVDFTKAWIDTGRHEFRVRCQDGSGCWEESWNRHYFWVYTDGS
jgi:hypothetical protein